LDLAASFANLEANLIMETLVRASLGGYFDFPGLMKDYNDFTTSENPNYFMAGYRAGEIFKIVTDMNVNN